MIVKKELTNVKGFTFVQNTTPVNFDVKDTWYNPDTNELKVRTAYGWVPYWEFNSDKAGYSLWVLGANFYGQLGQNNIISRSSPVQVGTNTDWSLIANGYYHSLMVKIDGTLWAWGYNNCGQLGQNDGVYRSSPVQVGSNNNWLSVNCDRYSSLAIKTDDTLWSFGKNDEGQLGLNDRIDRSSPVQVGNLTNWKQVDLSKKRCCAIKTDGTLWAWGYNAYQTLGLGDSINRSSPTQVGNLTDWALVGSGYYNSSAQKTDGTLWIWGYNRYGVGGTYFIDDYISSPVQVGSDTNWNMIASGYYNMAGIKSDGTLWAWGSNRKGQLGQNNDIYRSSPVQVGSDTNWKNIFVSKSHTSGNMFAVKTDGSLWAWGYNSYGQLGLNDKINRSSPVQVGINVNWGLISSGYINSLALKA